VLVPYDAKFGTQVDVSEGRATHVKDMSIKEKLDSELGGILNWLIEGARMWYQGGLNPPERILAASSRYRDEQNQLSEFVDEFCTVTDAVSCYLTHGSEGIYATYDKWCHRSGIKPFGKKKFLERLLKYLPGLTTHDKYLTNEGGRVKVLKISGITAPEHYQI